MGDQMAYALVTPYTIQKSRTGAVLSRLLGRTSAELIDAQVFAPDAELADTYARHIRPVADPVDEWHRQLIREYILQNFGPDANGRRHRVMMLVFRGRNAFDEVNETVGRLRISNNTGETIRDTYGDLVRNPDGSLRYFEPAVITADSAEMVTADLKLWLDFAARAPALLENICEYEHADRVQQTMVIIKPDSWRQRSSRPGAMIDMFSRTGLRIIGCKACRFSVRDALEFYGPVKEVLSRKLAPGIGTQAREFLEARLNFRFPPGTEKVLTEAVGVPYAEDQFERIVEFMSGVRPSACRPEDLGRPGKAKCLVLVYEGEDAVLKIRDVLGPTDPTKAPDGTIRREFGSDIMVNSAHASDSPENAKREMAILKMHEGNLSPLVQEALKDF